MTVPPSEAPLSDEYAALSRRYAERGDLRLAQLAAWAGDVHVLEGLLWGNGLADAPDPIAQLAAVGRSVAASIEDLAAGLTSDAPLTAQQVVGLAREAMVETFDASVHALLTDRLADLSQLDGCAPAAAVADRDTRAAARLDGRTPADLVGALEVTARDCGAMADVLAAGGEPEAAARLVRQAELAAFEAHLVTAATAAGDDALASVDLRWDLLADPVPARDRFGAVLGSAERDVLARSFAATGAV